MKYSIKNNSRGLSSAIAIFIFIAIIVSLAVPFLFYLQYLRQSDQVSGAIVNNYVSLKQLQYKSVLSGHPAIYYSAGTQKGSIIFEYTNGTFVPPINLTIIAILYLDNGVWNNLTALKYPIVINSSQDLSIPSYVVKDPIIIVTSLGNLFYLMPNSSIGPYSLTNKGGVEILAEITSKNNIYAPVANVTTNILDDQFKNYTMPVAFPNITGTFQAKVPQYVYYEFQNGTIITGVFHNWIIQGRAVVNSTTTQGISVTLERQSVVLIANYSELTTPLTLNVVVEEPNSPSTQLISIKVDGKFYSVPGPVKVLAGYVSVDIPNNYLLFNNTRDESNGYIYIYKYQYSQVGSTEYTSPSFVFFIPPTAVNPTLYIYYTEQGYYVHVTIQKEGNTQSYSGFYFILNGTVYDYGKSYWILAGTYVASPTGVFIQCPYPLQSYSIGALYIYYNNVEVWNYNEVTAAVIKLYYPGNIEVKYGINEYYQQL
ncbi:hypothetical protein [Stygiolobus caldivivus]|uniref:Uncharacterized protein n=1 Tax=Stygiolobus caldivivus TaxID=2824673 RepID=A0A8D5U727_9CREN|nr:hypothetical protein [Stygiolobus caldivivus]BCU70192.1 hypothetical protein KN1_14890 [Stygiolobus caldivivus]